MSESRQCQVEGCDRGDRRAGVPESLDDGKAAADRPEPVAQSREAAPALGVGTADPVVGDAQRRLAVGRAERDLDARSLRVLGDVRERLGRDVVERDLDGLRETLLGRLDRRLEGERRARARSAVASPLSVSTAG